MEMKAKTTSDANVNNIANTYQTKAKANVTAELEGTTLELTIN